jgi:hypothetical protein
MLRLDVGCVPTLGNERRYLRIVIRDKLEAENEPSERWRVLLRAALRSFGGLQIRGTISSR